ncbi:MAG: hypothetical protein EOO11_12265 [Chitinophagaceae bacterium]|nr:MAG: hypothetical protein EOO11_12265 [Chitinophagaceae bacterium]
MPQDVLIIGASHLAHRVRMRLEAEGYAITHKPQGLSEWKADLRSPMQKASILLGNLDLPRLAMAYVLDESDEQNLEVILALIGLNETMPITAALYNESLIPHLEAAHPRMRILNPARLAAPAFVDALDAQLPPIRHAVTPRPPESLGTPPRDRLMSGLLAAFTGVLLLSIFYYHYFEGLSWINSFYFVMVTVTTVGYGDINLLGASAASKLFGVGLILGATVFIWIIFSLSIDNIVKNRQERALGHRPYHYRNHVILCGLGRFGYYVAKELYRRKERFIIIEKDERAPHLEFLRRYGVPVYIGNARLPRVLKAVGAARARAMLSIVDNDLANLEIGLNARSLRPGIRVILRVFDDSVAAVLRSQLDIHLSHSTSALAEAAFVAELLGNAPESAILGKTT